MSDTTSTTSSAPVQHYAPAGQGRTITAQAGDGCAITLHVLRERTAPRAAPILFVHALAMDGRMWQATADALYAPGALYGIDCRGQGSSGSAAASSFTTEQFARDMAAALDAAGEQGAHVVGCSMGGTVALAFARLYPQRTLSLTTIDSTAWYGADAPAAWQARADKAVQGGMQALIGFQLARWFSESFLAAQPVLAQEAVDVFLANRVDQYAATCHMLGHADERAALDAYRGPVAVVVGEHDYATPVAMSQAMAERLAGARLTVVPGTRHYTPLEAPQQVAACIAEVMARAKAPA